MSSPRNNRSRTDRSRSNDPGSDRSRSNEPGAAYDESDPQVPASPNPTRKLQAPPLRTSRASARSIAEHSAAKLAGRDGRTVAPMEDVSDERFDLFAGLEQEEEPGDEPLLHAEEVAWMLWRAGLAHVERCTASGALPERRRGRPRRGERRGVHASSMTLNVAGEPLGIGPQRYVTINRRAPLIFSFLRDLGVPAVCSMLVEIEEMTLLPAITAAELERVVPRHYRKRSCQLCLDVGVL